MPFAYELSQKHEAKLYKSDDTTDSARKLQALYDQKDLNAYQTRMDELNALGRLFRLENNHVYELFEDEKKSCLLSIKFLVKGGVITWSFQAPRDQTYQAFRDLLYNAAADAHDNVQYGCERYYRGSDAYHIRKMHSNAGEANFNHNHYRRADGEDITPKEVTEHLQAFSAHQHGRFFFPDPEEVNELIAAFTEYWKDWNYTGADRPVSLRQQYRTENSQTLDPESTQEEEKNKGRQEPCRVNISSLPPDEAEKAKKLRAQGIGSELEYKRTVKGFTLGIMNGKKRIVEEEKSNDPAYNQGISANNTVKKYHKK